MPDDMDGVGSRSAACIGRAVRWSALILAFVTTALTSGCVHSMKIKNLNEYSMTASTPEKIKVLLEGSFPDRRRAPGSTAAR